MLRWEASLSQASVGEVYLAQTNLIAIWLFAQ